MGKPWLWQELHHLFDTNDGSLPEIHLSFSNPQATIRAYGILRSRSKGFLTEDPTYYSIVDGMDVRLDSVEDPAALVVGEQAEPFHVVLAGMEVNGIPIPDIGVFVLPREVMLDYRMGLSWRAPELEALFALLFELAALDEGASPALEECMPKRDKERFQRSWQRWIGERRAS